MSPIEFLKDKLSFKPKLKTDSLGHFYEKNEALFGTLIFIGGFVFDILTLSDVDDPFSLAQQGVYLFIIGLLLVFETLEVRKAWIPPKWLVKIWPLREIGIHFLLGSLLSLYSLFFFKSASLATSLVFMLVMASLLVANEFPQLQRRGPLVRWALWTLCFLCLMLVVVPMGMGFVGFIPFIAAWLVACLALAGLLWTFSRGSREELKALRSLFWPSGAVLALMLVLYLFKVVPPVPLVLQTVGIYHNIEKVGDNYVLTEERIWWHFWEKGDQDFRARPGDKIYVYVAITSPASISDTVRLRWMYKDARQGWLTSDLIPLKINGGRKEGYRGVAFKSRYDAGSWRVKVETTDEREIGRINFEVTKVAADPTAPAPEMRKVQVPISGEITQPLPPTTESEAAPTPKPGTGHDEMPSPEELEGSGDEEHNGGPSVAPDEGGAAPAVDPPSQPRGQAPNNSWPDAPPPSEIDTE